MDPIWPEGVVDGISFPEAYAHHETAEWDGVAVSVIGFDDLVPAKKAAPAGFTHGRTRPYAECVTEMAG